MSRDAADRLAKLQEICRDRGIPLTNQRRLVLEVVLQRNDHPTADQVCEAIRIVSPQISRRTVYRVLDNLVEWGLVRRLHHPGATARFDGMVHRHHHLVCTQCDKVVDWECLDLDNISLPVGKPHGFDVHDFSVQLMGLCPECRRS